MTLTFPSSRLETANVRFVTLTPDNFPAEALSLSQPYAHDLSTTRKLETERRYALELRESCLKQIIDMEVSMGIDRRWDPSSPEYLETLGYLSTRTYQRALEELQRLVIQRLFELHKMNISASGERGKYLEFLKIILVSSISHANAHCESIAASLQGDTECGQGL